MGRPGPEEPTARDGFHQQLPAALGALPSPASITGSLSSPTLRHVLNRNSSYSSQLTPRDGMFDGSVLPTLPGEVKFQPIMTPPANDQVEPDLNLLLGGALAPTHITPPAPLPPAKSGPGLRLPSFEQLGIAAPHPDRLSHDASVVTSDSGPSCIREVSRVSRDRLEFSPSVAPFGSGSNVHHALNPSDRVPGLGSRKAMQLPIQCYVNTITPPADEDALTWIPPATVQTVAMHSPPADARSTIPDQEAIQTPGERGALEPVPDAANNLPLSDDDPQPWYDGAIGVLLENLRTAARPTDALKILSHALPSTSTSGHIFTKVIDAIHISTPASPLTPLTWINVFHAIPGRFNLANLPTSPPNTPGPPVGGEDYFTQKVFDSAVSILDYQEDMSSMPRSPRPVVPPSSIDVSMVERYIPPSSKNEFAEMFDPNGSSILVDRLVELSPNNGSLLFIYPTKAGAQTFMRDYLGPILDPLLRTMVVVNGLSAEICRSLGSMTAVNELLEHDSLQRHIAALCAKLTQRNTAAQRFHGRRPVFSLSYAAKQEVKLARGIWAREWWTKQEKTRMKETIVAYHREAQTRRSSNDHLQQTATATVLLQQLLDGVAGKLDQEAEVPQSGIEVSVFVITRSE